MSKVFIEESTLTAIGDAIRSKEGSTALIAPLDMADKITNLPSGGGDIDVEPIVLTGDCTSACCGNIAGNYINMFGDTISTNGLTTITTMFQKNRAVKKIPFDLNVVTTRTIPSMCLFQYCEALEELPRISDGYQPDNGQEMFGFCSSLRNIPEDYFDNWNFTRWHSYSWNNLSGLFKGCYSLRKVPATILANMWTIAATSYNLCAYAFANCQVLDSVDGLAVDTTNAHTGNNFLNSFNYCCRLKDLTFAVNEDGSAKVAQYKGQVIDLTYFVGYADKTDRILGYNSGLTTDTEMTDDASYQALKDNPDSWTENIAYGRYDHDSAVRTINSLPDTSAYLAANGGTNTIKFRPRCGESTDAGAVGTLTETEIAIATAKGWTVTFV